MSDPCIAAVLYAPGQSTRPVLDAFIAEMSSRGLNVHGLVQESVNDHGMDAIDIRTAERIPLKRPTRYEMTHKMCSLDLAQLAEATRVLRRALDERADIVVVERFGKAERDGGGLADDLLTLLASGTPTVVTVPREEHDAWKAFSGGLGDTVPCDLDALMAWWDKTA